MATLCCDHADFPASVTEVCSYFPREQEANIQYLIRVHVSPQTFELKVTGSQQRGWHGDAIPYGLKDQQIIHPLRGRFIPSNLRNRRTEDCICQHDQGLFLWHSYCEIYRSYTVIKSCRSWTTIDGSLSRRSDCPVTKVIRFPLAYMVRESCKQTRHN